ncbi:hypothetical protein ACFL13_01970 [Patescibacteria group bacterium]
MKKLVLLTTFLAFFVFAGTVLAKSEKAKGPAEKATGMACGAPRGWCVEFNAHEGLGDKPAKGNMRTWSNEVGRELFYTVGVVTVDGNFAEFIALCTYDSSTTDNREGRRLYVKVEDNGEPGWENDYFGWNWDDFGSNKWVVTSGNIQVHTYETPTE